MAIPTALLRRFYVNNSLHSNGNNLSLKLTNRIAPTTLVSLGPIEIDDNLYAPDRVTVIASRPRSANEITERSPLVLPMGKTITIQVAPSTLKPGRHHVVIHAITQEVGSVSIEFDDYA